ncbi:MAG: malectin domain-containing carbohydrate-binding protein, partial [Ignavibacteria bacterium]
DFGENFNYVSWDNTEHSDYRSIYEWVDLNCGFIISVYEAFIADADQSKLDYFWPYLKKAAQRILDQVNLYGSAQYPYTFQSSFSSYDAGGNSQAYNTGLSITAYHIMSYLSRIKGETETDTIYQNAFQNAVKGFEDRWLDNPYPLENFCESVFGGPWIADFLKLGSFWPKQKLDGLFSAVSVYYDPLNTGMGYNGGTYSEWAPYLIGHLGGYALQTNRSNIWSALQKDWYERNYLNRNLVFNQQLGIPSKVTSPVWIAADASSTNQYISTPVLWRNYYNIAGYHRNEYSDELWLEPNLFDSLNHQLQDALIFTPAGYAAISCNTYGSSYQNQEIIFEPDFSMNVSSIYVKDLYSDSLNSIHLVKVNGVDTDFSRVGNGDQKHLKLNWTGTITVSGIIIQVEGEPKPGIQIPSAPENLQAVSLNPSQIELSWENSSEEISGYIVEINYNGNFRTLAATASSDTFFIDTGLLKSTAYRYRVRAFNSQGSSAPSNECEVTTQNGGNGEVAEALNAGGNSFLSGGGIQYAADAGSGWVSGGNIYSTTTAIEGTADDELYQTERYGNFSYSIPLENGRYDIVLKFAEIYQDATNTRVFHVDAEGERVIRSFDLYLRTGKFKAYDVVVPVEIADGMLNIDFISVRDNAKLSGMEIRRTVVGINEPLSSKIPDNYFLFQNYPNPFNPVTHIQYALPEETLVKIIIFNILGEQSAVLVDGKKNAGFHSVDFNSSNLPGGIYFYQITAGSFQSVKKMILLK